MLVAKTVKLFLVQVLPFMTTTKQLITSCSVSLKVKQFCDLFIVETERAATKRSLFTQHQQWLNILSKSRGNTHAHKPIIYNETTKHFFVFKQSQNGRPVLMVFQSPWMAVRQQMGLNGRLGTGFTILRMMGQKISIQTASILLVNSAMRASGMNSAWRRRKMAGEGNRSNFLKRKMMKHGKEFVRG